MSSVDDIFLATTVTGEAKKKIMSVNGSMTLIFNRLADFSIEYQA